MKRKRKPSMYLNSVRDVGYIVGALHRQWEQDQQAALGEAESQYRAECYNRYLRRLKIASDKLK